MLDAYRESTRSGFDELVAADGSARPGWDALAPETWDVETLRSARGPAARLLETTHAFGLAVDPNIEVRRFADVVVGTWLPVSIALNQVNRSLGEGDLYPFVLAPAMIDKLEYVDGLVRAAGAGDRPAAGRF